VGVGSRPPAAPAAAHAGAARLVAETRLHPPSSCCRCSSGGLDAPRPIARMPGVVQHTRDSLREGAARRAGRRRRAHALRRPDDKDARGSGADDPDGILNVAVRDVVDEVGDASSSWPTSASTSSPTTATAACSPRRLGRQRRHARALRRDGRRAGRAGRTWSGRAG
jgi:hypothetical protein